MAGGREGMAVVNGTDRNDYLVGTEDADEFNGMEGKTR